MISEKVEKNVLIGCLVILLFLSCDTFFFPVQQNEEHISQLIVHENGSSKSKFDTYEVVTNKRSFEVYSDLYYYLQKDDIVIITRSLITKSLLKIAVKSDNQKKEFKIGYITAFKGSVFVPLILITIIITLFFFQKFPWVPGRRSLILIIALLTILQLYFYLANSKHYQNIY